MKILFFTTAHNSLSQRAFVELVNQRKLALAEVLVAAM